MDYLAYLIDFILHIDRHLLEIVREYGTWTYIILFGVVFIETGLVVMPFLPGDSLLFAAGALAAAGAFDFTLMLGLLTVAAILGDTVNYWIGREVGTRVFTEGSRFFKQEHLLRTQRFYERHGGKTIILARFVPIIRTFAPFVAGIGHMHYGRFLAYNVVGGIVWVWGFGLLGYLFGNLPLVKKNFTLVIIAIIAISVLPILREVWCARRARCTDPGPTS
ncbi:MAG: DedA family protein [Deltaproteobacteria bacterium]|nr:MAG: DedA family protein [Deltaproteobacteria bacterium]